MADLGIVREPRVANDRPRRIQLSRARGWRLADHSTNYAIVDRRTTWGNSWTIQQVGKQWDVRRPGNRYLPYRFNSKQEAQACSVREYRRWLTNAVFAGDYPGMGRDWILDHLHELAGKDLCCWCPLPADGEEDHCHARVLLALSNGWAL